MLNFSFFCFSMKFSQVHILYRFSLHGQNASNLYFSTRARAAVAKTWKIDMAFFIPLLFGPKGEVEVRGCLSLPPGGAKSIGVC